MTIEIEGLKFRRGKFMLTAESLKIRSDQVTGIIGKNGSGKSTLLKLISGGVRPAEGNIIVDGTPVQEYKPRDLSRRISFVQQEIYEPLGFTVREVLAVSGYSRQQNRGDMIDALRSLEIEPLIDRKFSELSGGERRLVTLAATIYQDAEIMLMDEPTTFLDVDKQLIVEKMISSMKDRGKTVIVVMHDLGTVHGLADNVVMMRDGRIVESGHPDGVMNEENLRLTFGVNFEIYDTPSGKGFRGRRTGEEAAFL